MEPLLKQLRELPGRLLALPAATRYVLLGGVALLVAIAVGISLAMGSGDDYQYAFTNLSAEDGTAAAGQLAAAGIPYRLEAGGQALAVPAAKVYEARLLLASAGLPRAGGIGFELFDRGDIGVSEFTQRVNLRRAIEGELARTVGALAEVRSARVHVTLAEKGLYRDDDREASASVVLNLHPGRSLDSRQLAGIRHLVASAVPGLTSEGVTIVDGSGNVLSNQDDWANRVVAEQRRLEQEIARRIVGILTPAVGPNAVVAQVAADLDPNELHTSREIYDPDSTAVKNERRVSSNQTRDSGTARGLAGAAGNQPGAAPGGTTSRGESAVEDETRTYEVSKTVTREVVRVPRLRRLSVAVLVDGVDGKPRSEEEVARLGALAQRAMGFDEKRGDRFEIASVVFARAEDTAAEGEPSAGPIVPGLSDEKAIPVVIGFAALLAVAALFLLVRRSRRSRVENTETLETLQADAAAQIAAAQERQSLPDPAVAVRDRARELAEADPTRAAHLIRAWIQADIELERQQQQQAEENRR